MKPLSLAKKVWIAQAVIIVALVVLAWVLSFLVPLEGESDPVGYIVTNYAGWFGLFVALFVADLVLFGYIAFGSWEVVQFAHPLSFAGLYLFFSAVLLLSSFFVRAPTTNDGTFFDTHPLIFYTNVVFLGLTLVAAIVETVKVETRPQKKKSAYIT